MSFTSPQQVLCHLRHAFHMDDDGSRASSREFQEPDLPWAEDPPPNVQFGGEDRRNQWWIFGLLDYLSA